jgi:hypothetical protein
MKLLPIALLFLAFAATSFAQSDTKAAVTSATEKYVAANSGISKVRVTVEKEDGDYARAKAAPADGAVTDSVWVFLKKQKGTWTGLTLGTAFSPEDYRQLGIPRSLWVK